MKWSSGPEDPDLQAQGGVFQLNSSDFLMVGGYEVYNETYIKLSNKTLHFQGDSLVISKSYPDYPEEVFTPCLIR